MEAGTRESMEALSLASLVYAEKNHSKPASNRAKTKGHCPLTTTWVLWHCVLAFTHKNGHTHIQTHMSTHACTHTKECKHTIQTHKNAHIHECMCLHTRTQKNAHIPHIQTPKNAHTHFYLKMRSYNILHFLFNKIHKTKHFISLVYINSAPQRPFEVEVSGLLKEGF
jgi:hypothetical protein